MVNWGRCTPCTIKSSSTLRIKFTKRAVFANVQFTVPVYIDTDNCSKCLLKSRSLNMVDWAASAKVWLAIWPVFPWWNFGKHVVFGRNKSRKSSPNSFTSLLDLCFVILQLCELLFVNRFFEFGAIQMSLLVFHIKLYACYFIGPTSWKNSPRWFSPDSANVAK